MIEWKKETIDQFRKDYPQMTNEALSHKYGITISQLRTQAHKLSLEKASPRKQIKWDTETLAKFIKRYKECRTSVVAEEMKISTRSAQLKAKELGLTKNSELEEKKEQRQKVASMYGSMSNRKIARKLHISKNTVSDMADEMGLALSKEEQNKMRSEILTHAFWYEDYCRTNMLSHNMVRTLGFDKKRKNMEYRLAADGYLVLGHCDKVYYTASIKRHPVRERHAEMMGMVFIDYPQTTIESNEGAYAPENLINSSSMIIKGKITEAAPVRQITDRNGQNCDVQDFVLETDDEKPQHCAFEVYGGDISKFNIQKGEHLAVDITMRANKSRNGDWFGHNKAVNVTRE